MVTILNLIFAERVVRAENSFSECEGRRAQLKQIHDEIELNV
jgi:hypothetical protein